MSLQQTAYSLANFSVYPSRDQRAPYGTIHNVPIIQAIDRFAFDSIPVTIMKDGTLVVLQGDFPAALPDNLTLFRFLGGHKYISNGDVQSWEIIQRGTDPIGLFNPDNESGDTFYPGTCGCLVIQWTTQDESGNRLPIEDVYYTVLAGNNLMLNATAKKDELKAKLKAKLKK